MTTDQPRDEPDAAMSTPVASWPSYRCGNPDPHPAHRGMAGPSLCRGNPAPTAPTELGTSAVTPNETSGPVGTPAFTWAETVASYGIGPTATIDIDVHAPGHDEPVPVEIPLAKARTLYAHLGGVLDEHGDAAPALLARVLADQGVSQADLARRTRLSTKHVNQICQGTARTSVDVAIRLEFVLGIDAAEWMRADTDGQIAQQRDAAVLALVRPELERLRETRAAVDTAGLRERVAALFRTAPGEDRLGDEVPGYIADAVLRTLANPPAGGQETGAGQAGEPTPPAIVTGTDDEWCGSEPPPGEFTKPDGTVGRFGDCDCTQPPNHDGDCVCEPCRDRNGAPSWPNPNATTTPKEPTP